MKEKLKTKLRRKMRIRTLSLLTVMSAVSLSAIAAAPTVSTEAKKAADMINADAPMQKMLTELTSPQGQKWRFNTQMEIVRIASPSRSEMRRQQELMRLMLEEAHLALNDGAMFGTQGVGFVRLNVGTPRCVLRRALDSIRDAVAKTR